jgi:hypothetical protein
MTKKTTRTRTEAKKLMWEYYRDNRASFPKWIREFREEILEILISAGLSVEDSFAEVIKSETSSVAGNRSLGIVNKPTCRDSPIRRNDVR